MTVSPDFFANSANAGIAVYSPMTAFSSAYKAQSGHVLLVFFTGLVRPIFLPVFVLFMAVLYHGMQTYVLIFAS